MKSSVLKKNPKKKRREQKSKTKFRQVGEQESDLSGNEKAGSKSKKNARNQNRKLNDNTGQFPLWKCSGKKKKSETQNPKKKNVQYITTRVGFPIG